MFAQEDMILFHTKKQRAKRCWQEPVLSQMATNGRLLPSGNNMPETQNLKKKEW